MTLDNYDLKYEEEGPRRMTERRFWFIKAALDMKKAGEKYRSFNDIRKKFEIGEKSLLAVRRANSFKEYFVKRKELSKPERYKK